MSCFSTAGSIVALNTLFAYAYRASSDLLGTMLRPIKSFPLAAEETVVCEPASALTTVHDIYITDPPYGDAIRYEEILEFFISSPGRSGGWRRPS